MFADLDRLAERGALDELVARATAAMPTAEPEARLELHHYLSWAWLEMGDFERALEHARKADDPLDEAKALFHLWRFDEAARALEESGDDAEAHWYRSLVAEFEGGDPLPARSRAILLDPDRYHGPTRLSDAQIDSIVEDVLGQVPPEFAPHLQETVVRVLPLPAPHPDIDPLSLGLYVGHDIAHRSHEDGVRLPPRIEIYKSNIERIARDEDEAADELRTTLLHEMAHHIGFDEDGVAGLGLA